jgi:predicted permease
MPRWWKDKRDDRDFREEIESHLAHEADRQAAQRGLDPGDARDAARRAFGNVTRAQERFYESQRWAWAERLGQHLRYAVRALRARPGFSVAAIATLGVGIGFNTAIFTVFYAVAFRALPIRDADRLVNVYQMLGGRYGRGVHGVQSMISYPEYHAYEAAIDSTRTHGGALTSGAVYANVDLAFDRSRTGAARGEYVSCNYFQVLSTRMTLGRGFTADECRTIGESAVVVLSHKTWTRDLDSDSSVIGRVVRLNQIPFTVVGIAEQRFGGLTFLSSDMWLPVTMQPVIAHGRDSIVVRDWSWLTMAARLAPGGTVAAARAQLEVVARRRDALYPGRETRTFVAKGALLNFPEVRQQGALAAGLVAALGALVVAMVCANIMNLLLARGIARRREMGIRLAIGASRARLIEQLLTESVVLAFFGGVLGFALAYALPPLLPRLIPIQGLQLDLSPDGRVLAFSLIISLLTAVAFGLVPALQSTGVDLVSATKGGMSAGKRQIRPARLRGFVVGAQVAGSALLLIVAALFIRAASHAATVDPGYATENIVSFGFNMPQLGYSPDRMRATYQALRSRIAAVPGVESVALATPMPLLGRRSDTVEPEPASAPKQSRVDNVAMASVSGSYLATMQIPLIAGRAFNDAEVPQDTISDLPIVMSQSLATTLWGSQSALGKGIRMGSRRFVVVGIAADTRAVSLGATTPFIYLPAIRDTRLRIVARVRGSMVELERMVPGWTRELDPSLVVDGQRFSERMALELAPARLSSAVAATMGGLTMLLALVGIYGVVSYAVSQRTRDIAIRLALGSTQNGVVRLMMRQGSYAVVMGLVVGVAAAVGVAQVIRRFLLGVSPLDPIAYIGMAATLLIAALAAMYAPARRAARVNPALTLREE